MKVLSYGGGTQTLAMGRMAMNGDLERPDLVIFADTQRERAATYEAVKREFALLESHGIATAIVTGGDLAERGLRGTLPLTPLYTIELATGKKGQLQSICSERYKTRIVRREMRRRGLKAYDEAVRHSRPDFVCFVSDERRPLREVIAAASRQISLLDLDEEDSECSGTCFT